MPLARTQTRSRSNNNKMVKIIIKKLIKRAVAKDHSQASLVMDIKMRTKKIELGNIKEQVKYQILLKHLQDWTRNKNSKMDQSID